MAALHGKLNSIINEAITSGELHEVMRDIGKLTGVLKELSNEDYFHSPVKILKVLRVLNLLQEEALGLAEQKLENEKSLYYRYRNIDGEDITFDDVKHLIYVLGKYN